MGGKKKKGGKKAPVDAATADVDDSPPVDADAACEAEKPSDESVQGAASESAIVEARPEEAGNEDVDDEPTAQQASGSEAAPQFEDEVRSWHV
jgi:hypothetical protein